MTLNRRARPIGPDDSRLTGLSRRLHLERLEDRSVPTTFNVTTTLDVIADDGKRSLREAIGQANINSGDDIIVLPAGMFKITLPGAGDNMNGSGDFDIFGSVTIRGAAGLFLHRRPAA